MSSSSVSISEGLFLEALVGDVRECVNFASQFFVGVHVLSFDFVYVTVGGDFVYAVSFSKALDSLY